MNGSAEIDGKVLLIRFDRDSVRYINKQIVLVDARIETIGDVQFVSGHLTEPLLHSTHGGPTEFRLDTLKEFRAAVRWESVEYCAIYDNIEDCKKSYRLFLYEDDE